MKLFLGVDGGQSSTTALIGDDAGQVLGAGRGGPCNHVGANEGRAKLTSAVLGCLHAACDQAGLPHDARFEAACLGFSGGPEDKEAILREILSVKQLTVTNDAVIALVGATGGEPGIIVIAGTGSIALGRNAAGRSARAGGWGYIFGDEGGGFDLTRQAVRAALRYEEGWGPATALHALLLKETGAADANDLLHRFYTTRYPRPMIASYSKLVDQAANEGDLVARDLLLNAARQLADSAAAVRSQIFQPADPAAVAYIGGVFQSRLILERFTQLVELEEANHVQPPLYGPAAGALIEAYRLGGVKPQLSSLPETEK